MAEPQGGKYTHGMDVERVRDEVLSTFGRIDILVCAAGITQRVPTLEMREEDWQRIMDTNVKGAFLCAQQAVRHFLDSGRGGSIVRSEYQIDRFRVVFESGGGWHCA